VVDAEDLFLGRLKGEADPEASVKFIGNRALLRIFDEASSKLNILSSCQGTIYPDVMIAAGLNR